ncbi:ABC transporter permease [Pseudooceanicola sp. 200-1SW]|uniref:ABC transporter permease n=1 Tax=Pseudooceanicola sp. 200-1SW TaxID=3425949 RepID=UPI003D7FD8E7
MTPVLGPQEVMLAALVLLVNGAISMALSLGLARTLAIAALRMVAQLILLALVLRWLFALSSPLVTLAAMALMACFAGYEVLLRQERAPGRWWTGGLGASVMLAAGGLVVLPALAGILRAEPWLAPRVALPMFGMVAGGAMVGVALTLNTMTARLFADRRMVEARLALGQTRFQALGPVLRDAVRAGMLPTISNMAAIGLVTIPGMMTGQILAGADPIEAAKFQMLIMFLIAGTSGLAVLAAAFALAFRATDARHRLRLDRFPPAPPPRYR